MLVHLAALVVETVADLMADDGADAAIVLGWVCLGVEEGRLEDAGRQDEAVGEGVVEGVHRLRRRAPH